MYYTIQHLYFNFQILHQDSNIAQLLQGLLGMDLIFTHKLGIVIHTCNPSTWLEVQDHPYLHNEFEASQGYRRPYPQINKIISFCSLFLP